MNPTALDDALMELGIPKVMAGIDWDEQDRRAGNASAMSEAEGKRRHAAERREEMLSLGWPVRALENAENPKETRAITCVREWDCGQMNILILAGAPGCGKTTAGAHWALSRRAIPRFIRAATLAGSSRYDREKRDALLGASALVLDDLGAHWNDTKGSFCTDLDELVDVFYGNRKPLLVTTNDTVDDFRRKYGERVMDRFRECAKWQNCAGSSLRGRPQ